MSRAVLALLRRLLPDDWAGDVVRDLEVAHRRRVDTDGPLRAGAWLLAQAAAFALRFGWERIRERRPAGGLRGLLEFWAGDLHLTLRSIRRAPVFHAAVVVTLAVGLGANAAIFSVVRGVVLRPLPYPAADRLAVLEPSPWIPVDVVAGLEGEGAGVEALEGYYPHRFTVGTARGPVEMEGAVVTPGLLELLEAEIAAGRGFRDTDAAAGAPRVALLSPEAARRLAGDPARAVGRTLRVDGRPHEVVGVTGSGFRHLGPRLDEPAVWTAAPLGRLSADILREGAERWAIPVARLAPGGEESAAAALEARALRYAAGQPDAGPGPRWARRWTPLSDAVLGNVRQPLLLLQAAVGLVLLLAGANVANLLLVRAGRRRRELAIRTAMGASRLRLVRLVLTESLVLAVAGGAVGLGAAVFSVDALVALAPAGLPRIDEVGIGPAVLLATAAASVAAGLVFGAVPAWIVTREDPRPALRSSERAGGGGPLHHRLSQGLVVAQVTATLVLLVGAGLLGRSFVELAGEDPGFRPGHVLALPLAADRDRYDTVQELERYQRRLEERLARVPGVTSVALSNNLPHRRSGAVRAFRLEGDAADTEPREAEYGVVGPGYFQTLGIPLLRGRGFLSSDERDAEGVAVVDQALARRLWPDADPLGRRFRMVDQERWRTVVGVSGNVRGAGLGAAPQPGFHIPFTQRPETPTELAVGRDMILLVRTRSPDAVAPEALRSAVQEIDPGQAVSAVLRLDRLLAESTAPHRFRAVLLGAFAVMALLLAVAGIYGVVAQILASRTRELGVRRALGATGGALLRRVLGWGLRLSATGVAFGLLGVWAAAPLVSGLLHDVSPGDPAVLAAAVATVVGVTLSACLHPALRAARVDPRTSLRAE